MKAIIYTRISTNNGEQNINQQKDYCKKFADKEGYEIIHIIGDKVTGKIPLRKRRGGERLVKFLEKNTTVHLIVQDVDRLCRDYGDSFWLEQWVIKNNITIKSLSEIVDLKNPMGKFSFRIKMAMNAFYIENLDVKRAIGIARAKAEGKYKGRVRGTRNKK